MRKHGLHASDMDASHIIAESHGGANHPDNFHSLSSKFNRKINRYGDDVMCYLVGLEKAKLAVRASVTYGNTKYGKYKGSPSADMLFESGTRKFNRMWEKTEILRQRV